MDESKKKLYKKVIKSFGFFGRAFGRDPWIFLIVLGLVLMVAAIAVDGYIFWRLGSGSFDEPTAAPSLRKPPFSKQTFDDVYGRVLEKEEVFNGLLSDKPEVRDPAK